MGKEHILIVEDDEDILELIKYNLTKDGYKISFEMSGEGALSFLSAKTPDLILLDIMLPEIDGLEVCRTIKADSNLKVIPIIMLTAKGEEADIVSGLEMGADDYITKPFSPKVLIARIKTVLRRKSKADINENSLIRINDLKIDPGKHEVLLCGQPVEMTYSEFKILHFLAKRPGWVFTRYQIVDAVRGEEYPVTERAVDVQIVGLRKKLMAYGYLVETVRGVGYRFKDENA